tara:strand:- start:1089 stop:1598 length:510 start_codon:yes stop_codon:yes gene_type:complete
MILYLNSFSLFAQIDSTIKLDEVQIIDTQSNHLSVFEYEKLKRRVMRVLPYVDSVELILNEVDSNLSLIEKKKKKRKYSRKKQKDIIKRFNDNIKKLNRKEGVILTKLIHRKFELTAYQLVKSYRGKFQAIFWNRLAKFYQGSLKNKFDPVSVTEDMYIEKIIKENCNN